MKLSNFHKVETNAVKEAILGVAQDLKKIASKENITEDQKKAVNDAIMIASQAAENFDKLDKEAIKSSMSRCAKLVEAAFQEDVAPKFRDHKENQINKLKPVAPRAVDGGKVLLSLYPENNGMYNTEETKTCSPVDVNRIAEMIMRDLSKRFYPNAQEAYDGYCAPKGPFKFASAQQKVRLGVLLQNYGFAINYDKFEKEANKDKEAYLKQEEEKRNFAKGDNQTKKAKLIESKKVVLSIHQEGQASGVTNAYCSCGGDHGAGGGTTKHTIKENGDLVCNRCGSVKEKNKNKKADKKASLEKIEALIKEGFTKDQALAKVAGIGGLPDVYDQKYAPDLTNNSLLDQVAEKVRGWWATTKQPVEQAKVVELANSVDPSAGKDPQVLMSFLTQKLGEGIINFNGGEKVDYKDRTDDSLGNWTGSKKEAGMYCQGCGYTMADMVKTGNEDMCPKCGNKLVTANENFSSPNQQMLATSPIDQSTSLLDKYLNKETISTQNQLGGTTK